MPRVSQVVPISVSHRDKRLDCIDVLLLHLGDPRAGCEQGESSQSLHVRISLQLEPSKIHSTARSACLFILILNLR